MITNPVFTAVGWIACGMAIALLLREISTRGWRAPLFNGSSLLTAFCGLFGAAMALGGRIALGLLLIGLAALVRSAYLYDQQTKETR